MGCAERKTLVKKNGRIVYINGIGVIITDMDYGEYHDIFNGAPGRLNITFDMSVCDKPYSIDFSNDSPDSPNQHSAGTFKGSGDSFIQFLKVVETNPELRDKNQYSNDTKNAANNIIGAIAQSIYEHVGTYENDA